MIKDEFSRFHPIVNFVYFAFVLIFSMFFMSPVYLAVSLLGAAAYSLYLGGRGRLSFILKILIPMMLLAAIINPLFNHKGATVLAYFPNGNPLTLESILYGAAASVMLAATVLWFSCLTTVMTSDKLIYLTGRLIPSLSLLISMTLRFVPRFVKQMRKIRAAQRGMGCDASDGGLIAKIRRGVKIISIMVTWALENSVDTADSMRSRGFGTSPRSAFSIYKFTARDAAALIFIFAAAGLVIFGVACGATACGYFPTFSAPELTAPRLTFAAAYLALCLTPFFVSLICGMKTSVELHRGEN